MRTRINITSIVLSWIIAIGFLGLISVWSQPPAAPARPPSVIELSARNLSTAHSDLDSLQARAWCALDSRQVATLKTATKELRFHGSMAMAPHWRGEPLKGAEQTRLNDCVALRLAQMRGIRNLPGSERAALAFLFSDR